MSLSTLRDLSKILPKISSTMSSDDHAGESHCRRNPIRWLLGFGFFVQGLRGFPWLGVNFFLTDELRVNPSVLQLLQNSANLPMVAKPIYGIVSDAVYFFGQHRIPYIAIGGIRPIHKFSIFKS